MPNPAGVSTDLLTLVVKAVEHGLDLVARGDSFIPVLLTPSSIAIAAMDTMEEARAFVRQTVATDAAGYGVLVYDSVVMIDGKRANAVVAEAYERGRLEPVLFGQRYQSSMSSRFWRKARPLEPIGNLMFLDSNA